MRPAGRTKKSAPERTSRGAEKPAARRGYSSTTSALMIFTGITGTFS